jgi:hypothetical protein
MGATFSLTVPSTLSSGTVIHFHCVNHGILDSTGACSGMCGTLTVQ